MLGFSRKTDYALLIVTALAGRGGAFVSIRSLAKEYRLPYRFASQIVGLLARGAILESREGVNGGYRLGRDPHAITVRDVLQATEGDIALVSCLDARRHFACPQKAWCGAKRGMGMIQRQLLLSLGRTTVADFQRENAHHSTGVS